jgi:hypothetical protein
MKQYRAARCGRSQKQTLGIGCPIHRRKVVISVDLENARLGSVRRNKGDPIRAFQKRASQPRSAKWIRSHTPATCQSRRRRQHVIPAPHPSSCGSICQGMPLRRTKTMPVRHTRSETRDRRGGIGKNGSTRSHNGPGSSAAAITRSRYLTQGIRSQKFCCTLLGMQKRAVGWCPAQPYWRSRKNTKIPCWESGVLGISFTFCHFFNHLILDCPIMTFPARSLGRSFIWQARRLPSWARLGGDASARMIQSKAQLRF